MLLPFAFDANAQTTTDLGVWTSIGIQADLHEGSRTGPRLWTDLHARRTDASFLAIVRPAVGWDVAPGASVFVGYAWVPQDGDSTNGELLNEHRIWEQFLWTRKAGDVQLGLRPRLEQRFLEGREGTGHRLRLWGRAAVPVNDGLSLVATDEVFVGLVDQDWAPAGLDQNRLFVGPAVPVSNVGRLELGYTNVYILRETGNTLLHVVGTNLFLNL